MAERKTWRGLHRLKRVVNKIRFVLSFDSLLWRFSSMVHAPTRSRSLPSPPPKEKAGLLLCTAAAAAEEEEKEERSVRRMERAKSYSKEEDIDKRSEMFIANFYKQLKLERQISLDLRYDKSSSSSFNRRESLLVYK